MSYYQVDGASGVFAAPEVHDQHQTRTWRLVVASFLLVVSLALTGVAIKVFASVEQTHIELPKAVSAATAPKGQIPVPAVLASTDAPSELQNELNAFAANKPDSWAFYVQSLDGGDVLARVNDTKQFQMASIYKLFLLKPLAKKLPAEAWATTNVTERTYLACVQAMLAVSDNPCGEAIAGNIGWSNVHKQVQADGYRNTVLNSSENFNSTVTDTALLLDRLYHADGYDAKTKGIALDALGRRKGAEAIRRVCEGCTVYNKTGDLGGFKHDAAIVEKDGKAYVVVIFSKDATWAQLTDAAQIITKNL